MAQETLTHSTVAQETAAPAALAPLRDGFGLVLRVIFAVLALNAVVLLVSYAIGPAALGLHTRWLALLWTAALHVFIWWLPLTALIFLVGALIMPAAEPPVTTPDPGSAPQHFSAPTDDDTVTAQRPIFRDDEQDADQDANQPDDPHTDA